MSDDLAARQAAQLLAAWRAVLELVRAAAAAREALYIAGLGRSSGDDLMMPLLAAYADIKDRVGPDIERVRLLARAPYTLDELDKEQ